MKTHSRLGYEMLQNSERTHFDPTLIDIFMNNLEEFLKIKLEFDSPKINSIKR